MKRLLAPECGDQINHVQRGPQEIHSVRAAAEAHQDLEGEPNVADEFDLCLFGGKIIDNIDNFSETYSLAFRAQLTA
jgi:hypothetical protein